jgi:DHA2 family multidrug resistance protein-like MFS transporter
LLDSAQDAFASGFNVVAVVGTIAFVLLAVIAMTTLRRVPPFGTQAPGGSGPPPQVRAQQGDKLSTDNDGQQEGVAASKS